MKPRPLKRHIQLNERFDPKTHFDRRSKRRVVEYKEAGPLRLFTFPKDTKRNTQLLLKLLGTGRRTMVQFKGDDKVWIIDKRGKLAKIFNEDVMFDPKTGIAYRVVEAKRKKGAKPEDN